MEKRTYKDVTEFLKLWSEDSNNLSLRGMLKESKNKDSVAFSQAGCGAWVDITKKDIVSVEYLGVAPCIDEEHGAHEHPMVLLELKSENTTAGKMLKALAGRSSPLNAAPTRAPLPPVQTFYARNRARAEAARIPTRTQSAHQPRSQVRHVPMYSEPYCPNGSGPCGGYLPNGVECANYARPCYDGDTYYCAYSEYCDCVNNGC
jgi:hypothetical protein